jgi:tryptophan synthase
MSKLISTVFSDKSRPAFVAYVTAGYPQKSVTVDVLLKLQSGGADIIELGVPFSDPTADGPVIQESSLVALENGIDLHECFRIVTEARSKGMSIPVVMMGYYNPFLIYGEEKVVQDAVRAGVNGFIIVDLPLDEAHLFRSLCSKEGYFYLLILLD